MNLKELLNRKVGKLIKKEFKYKIGDIIWANMPEATIYDKNIKESHKIRPYLIIGINQEKNTYQALACTSKNNNRLNKVPLKLNNEEISYANIKNYVDLNEENIINFNKTINEKEFKEIIKLITIKCENAINLNVIKEYKDELFVEVGDVILLNDIKYYVYALENEKYHLLKTRTINYVNNETNKEKFYQNSSYYIDLTENILIDLKEPCIILDKFSNKDIANIDIKRKQHKSKEKNKQEQKKKNKTYNKNEFENIPLTFGDILKYKDKSLIYMYTDKNLKVRYLINQENLKQHPLSFCEMKKISTPFKKIGELSSSDILKMINIIKPLLPFIRNNNTAIREIQEICKKKETKIRQKK